MTDRPRLFNLRVSDVERAKLEALAKGEDMSASSLVRRWIRQHFEARFGSDPPPTRAPKRTSSR